MPIDNASQEAVRILEELPGPGQIHRRVLTTEDTEEVVLIKWGPQTAIGRHGHGISDCSFTVISGIVSEQRGRLSNRLGPGQTSECGPASSHSMATHTSPAITIHRYRPRLANAEEALLASPLDLEATATSIREIVREAERRPWVIVRGALAGTTIRARHRQIARALGTPLQIPAESLGAGTTIEVRPRPAGKQVKRVASFKNSLQFPLHTELPYLATPPTYVLLSCLDNRARCPTLLRSAAALKDTGDAVVRQLTRPVYCFGLPPDWTGWTGWTGEVAPPRSALSIAGGRLRVRCRFDAGVQAEPKRPESLKALEDFRKALNRAVYHLTLDRGDVLVVNNRVALHGRARIAGERHLIKDYVWDKADRAAAESDGHVRGETYGEFYRGRD